MMKNFSRWALFLGLAAMSATAVAAEPPPRITVTGTGVATAAPDVADVHAGVTREDASAARAMQQADAAMRKVVDAMRQQGVAARDIQTAQYSLQPVYDQFEGKSRLRGYRADNQVRVTVRDLARVGGLLDAVVSAGANQIQGIGFRVDKPEIHLDRARADAVADARRKAELYAKAAGVRMTGVLAIEEGGAQIPRPFVAMRAASMAADAVIEPGEQELSASVSVTFQIQP
jgi:uncharacterized protein YggE